MPPAPMDRRISKGTNRSPRASVGPDRWDWQTKRPEDMGTDMTFSASKSYLATVAGLALDRGLIRSVDDPVKNYVDDGTFDSPHNSKITWRHLLNHEIAARQRASDEKRKAETERQQGAMASQSTVAVQ
jgi:hypothetical protein